MTRYLLAGALLALAPTLAAAGVVQDCRAETALYGIPPEQAGDYVRDCIQSRGGYPEDAGQPATGETGAAGAAGDGMAQGEHSAVEETTDGTQ